MLDYINNFAVGGKNVPLPVLHAEGIVDSDDSDESDGSQSPALTGMKRVGTGLSSAQERKKTRGVHNMRQTLTSC